MVGASAAAADAAPESAHEPTREKEVSSPRVLLFNTVAAEIGRLKQQTATCMHFLRSSKCPI